MTTTLDIGYARWMQTPLDPTMLQWGLHALDANTTGMNNSNREWCYFQITQLQTVLCSWFLDKVQLFLTTLLVGHNALGANTTGVYKPQWVKKALAQTTGDDNTAVGNLSTTASKQHLCWLSTPSKTYTLLEKKYFNWCSLVDANTTTAQVITLVLVIDALREITTGSDNTAVGRML